jgi:LacI family transcriptional regulator
VGRPLTRSSEKRGHRVGHHYPIREIAQQAGVSEATVDRVLRGRADVGPSTVAEVERARSARDGRHSRLAVSTAPHEDPSIDAICSVGGGNAATVRACERTGRRIRSCIAPDLDGYDVPLLRQQRSSAVLTTPARSSSLEGPGGTGDRE